MPVAQVIFEELFQRLVTGLRQAQRPGYRRGHEHRVGYGGKRHEERAVLELVHKLGRSLQTQTGLTSSPWAGEGKQTHGGAAQLLTYLCHLALASHQWSRLGWQVVEP